MGKQLDEFEFTNIISVENDREQYNEGLCSMRDQLVIIRNNELEILSRRLKEASQIIYELAPSKNDLMREEYERKANFYNTLAELATSFLPGKMGK